MKETPASTSKICNCCGGDPQPLSNFSKDMRLKDCRTDTCNECCRKRLRKKKMEIEERKEYQLF
jgi:hypothetical protein